MRTSHEAICQALRWIAMRDAVEVGANWAKIDGALDMNRQTAHE